MRSKWIMLYWMFFIVPGTLLGTGWDFEEVIVDTDPLQPGRITDMNVVDINQDGHPDFWFSGRGIQSDNHQFAWYQNTEDISQWKRHTPFAGSSIGANWGDVDGDGDPDLITARDRGEEPFVWMKNPLKEGGDPASDAWEVYQIHEEPADPDEVHTGYVNQDSRWTPHLDLNADGRLDIVIAAFKTTLWFVPGIENPERGSWEFIHIAEHEKDHGGAELADLDGDRDLDIVWGRDWYENPGDPAQVPWETHPIDPDWTNETQVRIIDMDQDGWLDVVLTGEETDHGVAWYSNPGGDATGNWRKFQVIEDWEGLHSLDVTDFDNDGDYDIFTAEMHTRGEHRVAILENVNLTENLWEPHILSNVGSHKARAHDVDGDGDPDIIGKNFDGDKRPRLWINPNGPFTLELDQWERHLIDDEHASRYSVRAGDLNGDGLQDIITGTSWYENLGAAGGPWKRHSLGKEVRVAEIVYDLDGDGDLDVWGEGLGWSRNNGLGLFTPLTNIPGPGGYIQGMHAGRFRAGGPLQIAYTYKNGEDIRLFTLPDNPSAEMWLDQQIYDWSGLSKCIDLGDIDKDGDLDIMFTGRDAPTIQWLENEGNDRYTPRDVAESPVDINHRCHLGDINGDGRLDVVIGHKGQLISWYEQHGAPTDRWIHHVVVDDALLNFDPLSMDVADMDEDGDLDIIVGEHTPDRDLLHECRLFILENVNGLGTEWEPHHLFTGDEHHQGTQAVDIDMDCDKDIISVGYRHSNLLLYENKVR